MKIGIEKVMTHTRRAETAMQACHSCAGAPR